MVVFFIFDSFSLALTVLCLDLTAASCLWIYSFYYFY